MKNFRNILWGVVLVAVGLILGLNSLELIDFNIFFDGWWTLFIIVPCFINLFSEQEKTGNMIGLIFGTALLLSCQGLMDFDLIWKLAFPTILVVIGLSFIFRDTLNHKVNEKIKKLNKNNSDMKEYCSTFSEQKINFDDEKFKGCNLTAVFGGIECDLRKSKIEKDQVINVSAIFGGVDIFVPQDVGVKVQSTSIFGGVDDKNKNSAKEEAPTIYVNATCIFGGVEIR